jgi:L-fuculose-phosphate aldolase
MKSIPERLTGPEMIAYAAKFMFDRFLTDAAGGNLSLREGDTVYFSPTLAGTNYHWVIGAEDVVSGHIDDLDSLVHHPRFTREGLSHIAIYKAFPYVRSIIHAHAKYINPFVAAVKPIPPMLNASKYFGTLEYHEEAESYSQDQADKIVAMLKKQEETIKRKAAAVLMPRHGIILASASDMMVSLDCLERINNNAFVVLAQKLID